MVRMKPNMPLRQFTLNSQILILNEIYVVKRNNGSFPAGIHLNWFKVGLVTEMWTSHVLSDFHKDHTDG